LTSSIDTASVNFSQAIAFSADNKTLASASNKLGGVINLWTAQNGKLGAQLLSPSNKLYSIALSADNKTLADCGQVNSAATGVLELWNYATQKFLGSLPTSAEGLNSVQFSPDGKSVADGGSISNKGIVELWDVKSKSLVKTFPTQASSIHTVAFSPDGSLLAVGGNVESTGSTFTNSGVVELWNVSTGKLAASFDTNVNLVLQLAFSPDGKLFGVAGSSQTTLGAPFVAALEVWNTSKGTLADAPIITSGAHDVFSIAFSPAGKAFYIATDVDVEAFSVPKYAKLATYNPGGASSIAVSSRGHLLAVSSLIQWLAVSNIPFE
jgi:WD40 repeat protein